MILRLREESNDWKNKFEHAKQQLLVANDKVVKALQAQQEHVKVITKLQKVSAHNKALAAKLDGTVVIRDKLKKEVRDLREQIRKLQPAETDAGDTTKIIHFSNNPFTVAQEELQRKEAMKRARAQSESDDVPAKRRCEDEEEIQELKTRLARAHENITEASKEYTEVAQRYRRWCQNITGYQIKMRDQEHCDVASIYDPTNRSRSRQDFVCVADEERLVDDLDSQTLMTDLAADQAQARRRVRTYECCVCQTSDRHLSCLEWLHVLLNPWLNPENGAYELLDSDYIARWSEHMESYLDCGHSIPAFLAAVTLELEQDALNNQTDA
ncbi:hypothetical protein L596_013187 [Steinernema carpocapsae]|uniref:Uncharacterized protein n=1 Tax=Steinernema carpocapsae TaxID=34508 RepID=A0A4U5NZF6_STECR|nr:hypothetical protein L596_013187 [Steinernema carpocapsae]